jgi:hypothetical protein
MSCRDTTSHAPSGGPTSLIANSQSQALALLEQYPYRSRPTLPTHQSLIRHAPRHCCDNARTVAGAMSHDLSVCHSRAPSCREHLIMLRAMRLLDSPTVRRLRSLIELLASDDNHTRTTLQFVSRQIGSGDASCEPTATYWPRPNRFHFRRSVSKHAQRRRAPRRNLECPFPHSPPSKGTARRHLIF